MQEGFSTICALCMCLAKIRRFQPVFWRIFPFALHGPEKFNTICKNNE
jgi:hypothetical protein